MIADIEGFNHRDRDNKLRLDLRRALRDLLQDAGAAGGRPPWTSCPTGPPRTAPTHAERAKAGRQLAAWELQAAGMFKLEGYDKRSDQLLVEVDLPEVDLAVARWILASAALEVSANI